MDMVVRLVSHVPHLPAEVDTFFQYAVDVIYVDFFGGSFFGGFFGGFCGGFFWLQNISHKISRRKIV